MKRRFFSAYSVVLCTLLVAVCIAAPALIKRKSAPVALVYVGKRLEAELSLSRDSVFRLDSVGMEITVENGAAYVSKSSCRCKTCQKFGKLCHVGDTAVCLPSGVRIELKGKSEVDALI